MNSVAENPSPEITRDVFFRGGFEILQPKKGAHRAGMDALLLAACVSDAAKGHLADLGAGAGTAAFAALTRCPELTADLIEVDPTMVVLARDGLALKSNKHLVQRARVIETDIEAAACERAAGFGENTYDWVIANPPFNDASHRPPPGDLKSKAHVMGNGGFKAWLRTATAILKPKGILAIIARPANLPELLEASGEGFGDVRLMPVHPKAGIAANRMLFVARRGSRAPMLLLPGLVVHNEDGSFTDTANAIFEGTGSLSFG